MNSDLTGREHNAMFQTYKRLDIEIDRAEGCRIYDKHGNVYLDFLAGIAVNALGHSNPKIITAVAKQASRYMHVSNYFYQDVQVELAEKLKQMSGYDRVFFSNSGTEAMEGALKLARRHGNKLQKKMIYAFSGGFHGRTYGALSIMDKPLYKEGMEPFLENTKVLPYNDIESLRSNLNEDTCAVVLEFIQGEGGLAVANKKFVEEIFALRAKYGFLVVADEIQAGIGRTGEFFSFMHYGILPDIITAAKGLGGGLPLGAILAHESLAEEWKQGNHGTTFGGNALACVAGKAVLDELSDGLQQQVIKNGIYFAGRLSEIKIKHGAKITEVRGKGLMLGFALSFDSSILLKKLIENFVIANACSGNVLRIVPPLNIDKQDIDEFIGKLDYCLGLI